MTTLIRATDLQFAYPKHPVLKGIDFTVQTGELIGLIGANGAGKTTLLNLLLGLLPARGQLTIFGAAPGSRQAKAQLGIMRQGDLVLPGVTVLDLLTDLAAYYPQALAPATLLAEAGLTNLAHRRLTQLSGGQLRRVSLLTALVGQPRLLLLDEPTVGMDVMVQAAFWQQMRALQVRGTAIIITSHDLTALQAVAQRFLIMQAGRFVFDGSLAQLQAAQPRTEITFQTDLPVGQFAQLAGVQTVQATTNGFQLISSDETATLQALTPHLNALHQVTITHESLATLLTKLTQTEASK